MTRYSTHQLLIDILTSCDDIAGWTDGVSAAAYLDDKPLRYMVEQALEIAGESLSRLERTDPATAERIVNGRQIIGLRNRLAHGYDELNHPLVLEIAQTWMPRLQREVRDLLEG